MSEQSEAFSETLAKDFALNMWQAYCDKKMEVERLTEVNQELVEALENLVGVVWRVHGEDGVIRITKAEAALNKARRTE
jgi:hypothetical protein